jgi:hypothetical protein
MKSIDETTQTELEAAAFRRLLEHLRERTDVQNIDLMRSGSSATRGRPPRRRSRILRNRSPRIKAASTK